MLEVWVGDGPFASCVDSFSELLGLLEVWVGDRSFVSCVESFGVVIGRL